MTVSSIFNTSIATVEARKASVNAEQEQLRAAIKALTQAKTTSFNPGIRNAQTEALKRKKDQSFAQLKSANFGIRSTQVTGLSQQSWRSQLQLLYWLVCVKTDP